MTRQLGVKPTSQAKNEKSRPLGRQAGVASSKHIISALATDPTENTPVAERATVVSMKRHSMPPVLTLDTSTVIPQSAVPVRRRHEVKMDGLLKPVGSSENPAARKVAQHIESLNSSTTVPRSNPNTPLIELHKRSSLADTRQALLAKASESSQNGLPALYVPNRDSSLRHSRSIQPDSNQRFSTPLPLENVMAPPADRDTGAGSSAHRASSTSRVAERLAWARQLEDKNQNPGRDMVFQKLNGGVAAKLARFESQRTQGAGPKPRANSTTSRASEGYNIEPGYKRVSMVESPTAASGSVMTNFNDNFRAKMESLAGTLADKAQGKDTTEKIAGSSARHSWQPTSSSASRGRIAISRALTDMIKLTGADTEVTVNDYVGHGNFGRSRNMQEELSKVSKKAKPQKPKLQSSVPTIESMLNTPPGTPLMEAQSPVESCESPLQKARAQASAAGLSILVAGNSPVAEPTPARLLADINSPPCVASFSTLSSFALPLAKDEVTPRSVPAADIASSDYFNAATMPLFERTE